jgi:hypothetical protein
MKELNPYSEGDDGKQYFDDEVALSILLKDEILFCNERKYVDCRDGGSTIVLFVICNDIFAWGFADGEDLPLGEVEKLYNMHKKDSQWGSTKWCCFRRKEKPQTPVEKMMKKDGSWDEDMEKLPENHYDKMCREKQEMKKV